MKKCLPILFLLVAFSLSAWGDEASILTRRIQAHQLIKDYSSARQEAEEALLLYPRSPAIHEAYIRSLASQGDERAMLQAWNRYISLFQDQNQNRPLIEAMAWGVLDKAAHSSSLLTRLTSLLAGFFSQDIKGVNLLYNGMRDSNSIIRAVAVELGSEWPDNKLKEEVKRLFKTETVWLVRHKVIKAIGSMKIWELKNDLEALIASDWSSASEKTAAIGSLVSLLDDVQREEVERLASSNRAGLRLLACQMISHFQSYRDGDLLFTLAHDHHSKVRAAALQAMGILRPQNCPGYPVQDLASYYLNDKSPKVAISAAWLLTLYNPKIGSEHLVSYLNHSKQEIRLLAAAALSATGMYGSACVLEQLQSNQDSYVKINLAKGLIGQRVALNEAGEALYLALKEEKEKWIEMEEGIFSLLAPRSLRKEEEHSAVSPEMENQLVRLEILNTLSIIKYPRAQEAIKQFLSEKNWGVSGTASILLLTEGDESATDLVSSLLEDSNAKIRLQAALILSLWGREEKAIKILEKGYPEADKELKGRILEGIGRIGSMSSVSFLIEKLNESSQNLRIIAAMALIQCLNH